MVEYIPTLQWLGSSSDTTIENYLRRYVQTIPAVSRLRRSKDLDVLDRDLFELCRPSLQ